MDWIASIVVGVLAMAGTLGGAYFANRKASALIAYRLQELEKKVDKHNTVVERTYALERQADVMREQIRAANCHLEALGKRG